MREFSSTISTSSLSVLKKAKIFSLSSSSSSIAIKGVCSESEIRAKGYQNMIAFYTGDNCNIDFGNNLIVVKAGYNSRINLNQSNTLYACYHDPKLLFCELINELMALVHLTPPFTSSVSPSAKVSDRAIIHPHVQIGDSTIIEDGAVIHSGTRIGNNCLIKNNAVIGNMGFSFARDSSKLPIRMIHLGGVSISSGVEIGSFCSINRGTLEDTSIGSNTKIDDHCHVAHNVIIGENNLICAGSICGGSVIINDNCWIGINSTIHQKVLIASGTTVGMGALIFRNTNVNDIILGTPGRKIPRL